MRSWPAICLASVLLAGCVSDPGPAEETPSSIIPPATTDPDQGNVAGVVVDEEARPLVGVDLALLDGGPGLNATSAADGSFAFSSVAPGTHRLVAQLLGYETVARKVDVAPGETTQVTVAMAAVVLETDWHETKQVEGNIACAAGILFEWACGETIYHTHWYPGGNAKHQINWTVPKGISSLVIEVDWTPQSDMAKELSYDIREDHIECHIVVCIVGGMGDGAWHRNGPPVLQLVWGQEDLDKFKQLPVNVMIRVTIAEENPPTEAAPHVLIDQRFTFYHTSFYGAVAPEGFTAAPPRG